MPGVIDADTHIAESEAMWQMIDEKMYPRRPVLLSLPDDTLYGGWNATWLIDGNIFPKPVGKGGFRLVTPSASKIQSNRRDIQVGCRELTDVAARLADMDRGGIAAQVVYPTLFLIISRTTPSSTWHCAAPITASWRKPARRVTAASTGWRSRRCAASRNP